jgi:Tol biopolymer transport system component
MTTSERFERDVPGLLEELYLGPTPAYRDDILRRTAATRQRPGWTFIERWIPVSAITGRLTAAPRVPWRAVGLATLLIIALAALAIYVGNRQSRVPPPFGPAANGQIPYVWNGNIYLGDPVTGKTRLIVGDAGDDAVPQFSPDGTKLTWVRDVPIEGAGTPPTDIYVANADGTDRRKVNAEPLWDLAWVAWTPDSAHLAVIQAVNAATQLDLLDAVGNGAPQRIAAATGADSLQFRPPDGREILFRGRGDGNRWGLYAMDADGTDTRLLVESLDIGFNPLDLANAVYSADGSQIFYQRADPEMAMDLCCRLWVANADDGSDAHEFVPPDGRAWDGQAAVSPDGRWIAYWHRPSDESQRGISVVSSDGNGPVINTEPKLSGTGHFVWSPDSTKILLKDDSREDGSTYLVDPKGGPSTEIPWVSDDDLDWQRKAMP